MSTDYNFVCHRCRKIGGHFERKAGYWGTASIIDSFRFIMKHADQCGEKHIGVISEHSSIIEQRWMEDYDNYLTPDHKRNDAYQYDHDPDLKYYFPHSSEWDKKSVNEKGKKERYEVAGICE